MGFYRLEYVLLVYDVGEKRVGKVFKIVKKYLMPLQRSVFRGPISETDYVALKKELLRVLDLSEDFVCFMRMTGESAFREERLGEPETDQESLFI